MGGPLRKMRDGRVTWFNLASTLMDSVLKRRELEEEKSQRPMMFWWSEVERMLFELSGLYILPRAADMSFGCGPIGYVSASAASIDKVAKLVLRLTRTNDQFPGTRPRVENSRRRYANPIVQRDLFMYVFYGLRYMFFLMPTSFL
jgi:hypothetical protein